MDTKSYGSNAVVSLSRFVNALIIELYEQAKWCASDITGKTGVSFYENFDYKLMLSDKLRSYANDNFGKIAKEQNLCRSYRTLTHLVKSGLN